MNLNEYNLSRQMPIIREMMDAFEAQVFERTRVKVKASVRLAPSTTEQTMENTIKEMCGYWNISVADLTVKSRTEEVVAMRKTVCYVVRMLYPKVSAKVVATLLGYKDHTTVLSHTQSFTDLLGVSDALILKTYSPVKHLLP